MNKLSKQHKISKIYKKNISKYFYNIKDNKENNIVKYQYADKSEIADFDFCQQIKKYFSGDDKIKVLYEHHLSNSNKHRFRENFSSKRYLVRKFRRHELKRFGKIISANKTTDVLILHEGKKRMMAVDYTTSKNDNILREKYHKYRRYAALLHNYTGYRTKSHIVSLTRFQLYENEKLLPHLNYIRDFLYR